MIILGIETSCDESAASVVKDGKVVLSSVVASQIKFHKPFSGVVPEIASRAHVLFLNRVIDQALSQANLKTPASLSAIGVTVGPGLAGSLLVGRMTAEALGWVWKKPVIGVNHIEGHLLSSVLGDGSLRPPFLGLVVSGGHTELILVRKWGDIKLIGRTRDDAAGEAFDKVAKMLDLNYPGGPEIDRLAKRGHPDRFLFPRAWLSGTWDFSFSGLKTSVLYKLREKKRWSLQEKRNMAAGFQESVVDVLVGKTFAAARAFRVKNVAVGGGVAANSRLRKNLSQAANKNKVRLFISPPHLCTDNAAMIAAAAYFKKKYLPSRAQETLRVDPQLHIPFETKKRSHPRI